MPSTTDCWGIEVGANAIKAVRMQRTGKDAVIVDHDLIPFKKVLTTPDLDVDEAIRLGLDQLLSRHSIGKASIVVSVPGHMAFARFAKLPPVEPKRVLDIVKFEAVQQIPFPIEQVEWDYQVFEHPDSPDVEVGIFAITKDRVQNWLSNFEALGVTVHAVTLSPLAAFNALVHDLGLDEDAPGTIIMDIGTSATDLIISEGGRLWMRTIPIGGHHFTETLVRSFKLSYSKAEKIKREAATSKYARQIFQAMRPVFVDLAGEVQKSLGYYQSLQRDADLKRLIGLGGTFRLPGLQKFLKQQLQVEVGRLDRFRRAGDADATIQENALTFAPAYGLALQGIEGERVSCNILPSRIIRQQVWKAKQPWLVAATVGIVAAAGVAYGKVWTDTQAYRNTIAEYQNDIQQVLRKAEAKVAQWNEIQTGSDPRAQIDNLRRILDYRRLWPMIMADIQNAVGAAEPQSELLSGDPELVKQIPRPERRQIFIEQVTHDYQPGNAEPGADPVWGEQGWIQAEVPSTAPPGTEQFGRGIGGPSTTELEQIRQQAAARGGAGMRMGGPPIVRQAGPPSILITITGRTPRQRAAQFLSDTFVRSLEEQSAEPAAGDGATQQAAAGRRGGRDYRIRDVSLVTVEPVPEGRPAQPQQGAGFTGTGRGIGGLNSDIAAAAERARMTAEATQTMSRGNAEAMAQQQAMRAMQQTGLGGTAPQADTAERQITVDLSEINPLLPGDPLADEDRGTDWRFEVTCRVELVLPGEGAESETPDSEAQPVARAETTR